MKQNQQQMPIEDVWKMGFNQSDPQERPSFLIRSPFSKTQFRADGQQLQTIGNATESDKRLDTA